MKMKIAILIYLLSSTLSEVFGDNKQSNVQQELTNAQKNNVNVNQNNDPSNNKDGNNNYKRDSSEQVGIIGSDRIIANNFQPIYHPGYYQGKQLLSPVSPQISFVKSGAPKLYQQPIISAPASAPIISYIGPMKSLQHAPLQYSYALQSPFEYAIAIAPYPHHQEQHHAIRPQVYLAAQHGGASAAATSPSVILAFPQNLGHQSIEKNRIIQYAIMPASELSLAKYLSSQPLLAHPQPSSPSLYHQPVYAYSIQPSVQIAPAAPVARQIPIAAVSSPGSTLQYNKQPLNYGPPPPPSFPSHPSSSQIKQLLNSFPQHVPPHQQVTPKSISTVAPPPAQQPVIYSTTAAPSSPSSYYSNAYKVNSNNNNAVFYATAGDPSAAIYSQPGAIHYGTHLYHPNLNKIPSFGISVRKY